jgi:hypothetical protein
MAKNKDKKKPSRNVLVLTETIKKGRGKNKHTEVKAKRGRLGSRLFCVPLTPKKRGKEAKFECFGSWEDAQAAILSRVPAPAAGKGAFSPAALAEMDRVLGSPSPAFSPSSLKEMEKSMKGLRGLRSGRPRQPDLSERPAKAALREHIYSIPDDDDEGSRRWDAKYERLKRAAEEEDERGFRGLRGALPARGLRGTPEEHLARYHKLRSRVNRNFPILTPDVKTGKLPTPEQEEQRRRARELMEGALLEESYWMTHPSDRGQTDPMTYTPPLNHVMFPGVPWSVDED